MSLVGTRPPTVDEWDKYELHHRARLATKPGLTGMWQVSGRSNITDFFRMDGILYLIFIHRLFTIPRNVLSFILTVFIVGSMLHQGMIKMPGVGSDYVSNGALTCLSNIIKENEDKTWTIVSANDETQMGLDHGWHYETISFLRNMEYMNKDTNHDLSDLGPNVIPVCYGMEYSDLSNAVEDMEDFTACIYMT